MLIRIPFALLTLLVVVVPTAKADETAKTWARKLQSGRRSEWRVAQAYLARAGTGALPELAKLADGADDTITQRLNETVSLMLRNTTGPEPIREQTKLWATGEPALKRASLALGKLAGSTEYDSGELGPVPAGPRPPLTVPRRAIEDLIELRGFAVPAALELLADKRPASRAYGVEVLMRLNAIGQYAAVKRMLDDTGPITVSHGDSLDLTTVGNQTAAWLKQGRLRPTSALERDAVVSEAENYANWLDVFAGGVPNRYALINRLRQEAGTFEAKSWDDYWQRAKPVLETAWDHGRG